MDGELAPRRILADSSLVVLATVGGGALLFAVNLFLARSFGPEEFGSFRLTISLFSFLVIFIECGAGPSLIKYTADLEELRVRDLTRKILGLRAAGYLALLVVCLLAREPLALYAFGDRARTGYVLAGAIFLAFVYFDIFRFVVLAHQRTRLYAGSIAATFFFNGALAVALGLAGGAFGAVVGWSLGYLAGNLWNMRFAWKRGLLRKGEPVELEPILLRYGLPMQVQQAVRNLDLAVIPLAGLFYEPLDVGALAFAMVFYRAITVAVTAFNAVLLPRFARLAAEPAPALELLRRGALLFTPAAVLGGLAALLFAEPVIAAVDPAYLRAAPVFRTLVLYALASGYAATVIAYGAGTGKVRLAILATAVQQAGLIAASFVALEAMAP